MCATKEKHQWKDERSAKENARAWIKAAPHMQSDIAQVLANCPDIGPVRCWSAEPEARVSIDRFRGEQPNIDLLLLVEDDNGSLVVAIEAKVDEPFGKSLADQYGTHALHGLRILVQKQLRVLTRCSTDSQSSSSRTMCRNSAISCSRQPTRCLRRLSAAERAVLIVHEFLTPLTVVEKRERNAADLHRFLATALCHPAQLACGDAAGPISVDRAPSLYIGKACRVI